MTSIDHTHDAKASSWVESANGHAEFPIQNLPLGIFSCHSPQRRIGIAIGDYALDLAAACSAGLLPSIFGSMLSQATLNILFAQPAATRVQLRHAIFDLLHSLERRAQVTPHLYLQSDCELHLPAQVGDYTDFYAGIHHATNIGKQFRPDNPLLANYKYVPIGYHGRASSIRVSGMPVTRPRGQHKAPTADLPSFGPSKKLDYELELGIWLAGENELGVPVPIQHADDRIAGFCLLNDWSARDLQAWEYQPLGPFLAKSFLTTVSPWVVTREAMAPFRISQPPRPAEDPAPMPYLLDEGDQRQGAFAIELEVLVSSAAMRDGDMPPIRIGGGPASNMYWTVAQLIAHHTSNGCNLLPGDLLGTGTISTDEPDGCGSLMETSVNGSKPIILPSGEARSFLADGDEVILRATAVRKGYASIGFGSCRGTIQPAK